MSAFNLLRGYYNRDAVVQRLKGLPPLKTTVVDTVFSRKVNHPFPKVGQSDMTDIGVAAPLIMRGAPSMGLTRQPTTLAEYEPVEAAYHDIFTASDLLNLRQLTGENMNARLAGVDDRLRRTCRATAEGVASTALTGVISWPVEIAHGQLETYQVDFGSTLSHAPAKNWNAVDATMKNVFDDLQDMETAIQEEGYGGEVTFWAGREAYSTLLALAETYQVNPKAKLRVDVSKDGIDVGGFLVKKMAETYHNPATGGTTAKVPTNKIMGWATDAPHTLYYCALDDLDGQLQALPYFSKPIKLDDPSGVKIVGRSKPFPVPVVKAICWATVIA